MNVDRSPLTDTLEALGVDGYLIDDDSSDADQRYLSGFGAPDPFQTLVTERGLSVLVSGLEYGRATAESRADSVSRTADYNAQRLRQEYGPYEGRLRTIAAFLADHGVESVAVPRSFPTGTADGLRELGLTVTVETDGVVERMRAVKTEPEIDDIRTTQAANERAMATAESLIAEATVDDGTLQDTDGDPLTSERVTRAIERTLLEDGCELEETIVACGSDGADPHNRGSGPLSAGELIVVDIFPRDKETKYFGDMTRTFLRGEPTAAVRERYETVYNAFEAALESVEAGVTGAAVHDAACDVIEDAGYDTLRSNPRAETGFIHSTGHGVGLDLHESPSVSPSGEELEAGHVITIEPGLYDPAVGGIRLEDLVVVTEEGYENLTAYPIALEPESR